MTKADVAELFRQHFRREVRQGMDGLSLLREVRKSRPDIPVMMVTA